jgi:hypothetical protein
VNMDIRIGSSGSSVTVGGADAPPDPGLTNLSRLDLGGAGNEAPIGRSRGRSERPRDMRPRTDPNPANSVAPRRTEVSRYISRAYGSEQPSRRSTLSNPSFELSFGNTSIKIGGNNRNGLLTDDGGGRLLRNIQNTDCFGTGSDYQAFSFASGSDTRGTGGVVTSNPSAVAQTDTDTNTVATPSQTATGSVQTGNPTPTEAELKAMSFSEITAMFKAQSADDTAKMIAAWSPNGQPITKAKLTEINPALAEKLFEQYPGDSIDVSKLTAFATALKTTAASGQEEGGTPANVTGTNPTSTTPTATASTTPLTTNPQAATSTTNPTTTTATSNQSNPTATPTTTTPTTTPTPATATENNTAATANNNATTASSSEIDAKVAELLAKYAPKSAAKAKTHEALCKLAAKIAGKLTGAKKEAFLSAIETLGAPMGLNYSLSRTTADGKIPLNQKTAAQSGNSPTGTGAGADANNAAGSNTPTTTANPTPTADEFKTMQGAQLVEMLKAQSDEQTTSMIKRWSTDDGKTVTKAELTKLNPVMAKFAFEGVTGDTVEVEALTTKVLQLKEKAKAASAGTTTPTSTDPQTGTGAASTTADDATFSKLNFNSALAAIKNETEINTVSRVKRWSSDGVNISKADLEKANPQLAASYEAFTTNPSATVTIADMAEALNGASSKARTTTTAGATK